eukprot:TRINITY_DN16011_c0_g1_i1.p1 TRINITY_DN16011_c0_g1~~TRINITY_DN16011_c0_g1_i1.p1  ORF type:complete len:205 (-),score=25.07 TRINITY_DN16011_c0_g1_i1:243-857(-)
MDHRDAKGRSILWTCKDERAAAAMLAQIQSRKELMSLWKKSGKGSGSSTTLLMRLARCCYASTNGQFEKELDRVLGFCSSEEINAVDHRGRSALCHSLRTCALAEHLLGSSCHRSKVDVNAGAPLLYAVGHHYNWERVTNLLLDAGTDANCCDSRGANALNVFMRNCCISLIHPTSCTSVLALLLDAGADHLKHDEVHGFVPLH